MIPKHKAGTWYYFDGRVNNRIGGIDCNRDKLNKMVEKLQNRNIPYAEAIKRVTTDKTSPSKYLLDNY